MPKVNRVGLRGILPWLLLLGGHASHGDTPGQVRSEFDRTIAPLLTRRCLDCHAGRSPKGSLDLSSEAGARRGGDSGPAVVPMRVESSMLWDRVESGEMPPGKALASAEREALRRWIEAGASWGTDPIDPQRITTDRRAGLDWWSLRPIRRPEVPAVQCPDWSRNPIDRFILAGLEARGLSPSPEAPPRTLVRRLAFDLLGLPPGPEEVDVALTDDPEAYDRLVERYLASPHQGERWARHWLDVVRYGESDGFERNGPRRNAWPYRDWVIRSLNSDLPFDEFCRLQVAGDVLRPDDPRAIHAVGYLVAGLHNTVIPLSDLARQVARLDELEDLIGSVGQTFLGLTVNCGRCHDHKFDPITQKDYYRLSSALSGIQHGERDQERPSLRRELDALQAESDRLAERLSAIEGPARRAAIDSRSVLPTSATPPPSPVAAWDFRAGLDDRIGGLTTRPVGAVSRPGEGAHFDGKTAFLITSPLTRELREKTIEGWVRLDDIDQRGGGVISVQSMEGGSFDAIVFGEREPGRWMAGSDGFARSRAFGGPRESEARARAVHLAITYRADGTIRGYRDGRPYGQAYKTSGPVRFPAGKTVVTFGLRHQPAGGNRMLAGTLVRASLYDRCLTPDEIAGSAALGGIVEESEILGRLAPAQRAERVRLMDRRMEVDRALAELRGRLNDRIYTAVPEQPTPTRLLVRGQAVSPAEVVAPGALACLAGAGAGPGPDFDLPADAPEAERRRRLAAWLTHPSDPLLARVIVNRLWQHHFGTGLVETPNDFGFNGGRPSHPELLDWLASELVRRGFSLKAIHRLIVTSSTYRQASRPRPDGMAIDADDRLLWRMKPRRVEGEVLRDAMLAAAGLLNPQMEGVSFSDYRETSGNGTTYFDPIDPAGPPFHRRSIYRFNPRGSNQGLLSVFDCPDPSAATPRRNVTTTPLQALALWNDAFSLRMADAMATRILMEIPGRDERASTDQVRRAYRVCLQRDPTAREAVPARRLAQGFGISALCRALLNTNEFVTVE